MLGLWDQTPKDEYDRSGEVEKGRRGIGTDFFFPSPASSPSPFITRFNLLGLSWIIRSICSPGGDLQMFAARLCNLAGDRRPPTNQHHQPARGTALYPPTSIPPKHAPEGTASPKSNSPCSNGRANLHGKALKSSLLQLLSLQIFGRLQGH